MKEHNNYSLLVETSDNIEVLTEQTNSGKSLYIHGIFAQAGVVNGNKRFYHKSILEKSINDYIVNKVQQNRALGELNHPDYPMPDPRNAAILIKELSWQGNNVIGKALVLDTPQGQIVRGLLEGGFRMGVSTRALGSVKESGGIKYVQENLLTTAIDCVDGPSGPDCYVDQLVESTRWSINESGQWIPITDNNLNEKENQELFFEKLERFIKEFKVANK